jgi:hypothetical protein
MANAEADAGDRRTRTRPVDEPGGACRRSHRAPARVAATGSPGEGARVRADQRLLRTRLHHRLDPRCATARSSGPGSHPLVRRAGEGVATCSPVGAWRSLAPVPTSTER